jgi:hypothetical protein
LQLLAHLGEGVLVPMAEPEAKLQDELFAWAEGIERRVDIALQHGFRRRFVRSFRNIVGDQIAQAGLILGSDRRLE